MAYFFSKYHTNSNSHADSYPIISAIRYDILITGGEVSVFTLIGHQNRGVENGVGDEGCTFSKRMHAAEIMVMLMIANEILNKPEIDQT